jgi:hypothetical protein
MIIATFYKTVPLLEEVGQLLPLFVASILVFVCMQTFAWEN